jgi:hypothetical protein
MRSVTTPLHRLGFNAALTVELAMLISSVFPAFGKR